MASDDSLGNVASVFAYLGLLTVAQVAPADSIQAVLLLTPKQSGIFRVDVDVAYADNTDADNVTWRLTERQVTVSGQGYTVGGTTPAQTGYVGKTAGGGAAVWTQTDGSGGVTITNPAGGGSGVSVLAQETIPSVTGLLTASGQRYSVHGVFGQGGIAYPLGRQMAFAIDVSATDTIHVTSVTFSIEELPWQ